MLRAGGTAFLKPWAFTRMAVESLPLWDSTFEAGVASQLQKEYIGFCPGSHSTQNSACGRVCSPAQERGPGLVPGGQDAGCGGTGGQVGFQVLPLVSR